MNLGSDIDTLCVAPRHVTREDFFGLLQETLRQHPEVKDIAVGFYFILKAVTEAYVPVLKFEFSDIPVSFYKIIMID